MTRSEAARDWRACVVGGDGAWRQSIALTLASAGWQVSTAEGVPPDREGLQMLVLHRPSLPEPLTSVLSGLRAGESAAPIVFVFDLDPSSEERAEWLEAGATDVIGPHQTARESLARVARATAHLRTPSGLYRVGPFRLDLQTRRAWAGPRELHLTRAEFGILALLAGRQNELVSHDEIRMVVMGGSNLLETSRVRTHMSNLRGKLGQYGALLETVVPRNYRLSIDSGLRDQTGEYRRVPKRNKTSTIPPRTPRRKS